MACVTKNTEGRVISVENNQGESSQLYADALALTNNESEALNIWSVAYSEEYQQSNGVIETEPDLENVLIFMQRNNSQDKKLSKQDIDEIRNNTLSIPFSFVEELHTQIQYLYPQGVFTISKKTLVDSKLYSNPEIEVILSDSEIQTQIKTAADKIIAEVSLNDVSLNEVDAQMALYETPQLAVVYDTNNLIGLGKFEQLNPFLIDKELRQKVGGIKSRDQFEQNLQFVNQAIVERYNSDPVYANNLFEAYSQMDRMLLLEDNNEGGLSPVVNNNIQAFTEQALVVGQPSQEIKNIIDLLQSTPRAVWAESGVEIEDMLLRVEDYAVDLGIDVIGLSEQEFTYDEAQQLLDSVVNLVERAEINAVRETDLQYFYDNYNIVFQNNLSPIYTARDINANNKGRNLVVVDTIKTEQELFDSNGLIKANTEGVYHRVNRLQDVEQLYDYVTDLVQFNPNVIDKKALYPSAYTAQGNFSYQRATNLANREDIRQDIIRYVQQQPFSQELTLYKIAFGHPMTFPTDPKSIAVEYNKIENTQEDYEYLTQGFIADFAREYLQEKLKDSEVFNKVLKHFGFNERGIILKDTDLYSKQEIRLLTPTEGVLSKIRDYSFISKDTELNSLFTTEKDLTAPVIPQEFQRQFYINNPKQLVKKTLQYELTEDGEYLAVQNLQDNYINIEESIWEKAKVHKNLTVYQRLPQNDNPYFNNYNIQVNINTDVPVEQFNELVQVIENVTNIEKLYTKKELESINQQKECK